MYLYLQKINTAKTITKNATKKLLSPFAKSAKIEHANKIKNRILNFLKMTNPDNVRAIGIIIHIL